MSETPKYEFDPDQGWFKVGGDKVEFSAGGATTLDIRAQIHLMECLACHRFGTPIRSDDTVCGNCGSTETRMWFRYA